MDLGFAEPKEMENGFDGPVAVDGGSAERILAGRYGACEGDNCFEIQS